jgi:hypothetical protein
MPCDTRLKENYRNLKRRQTISERAEEIRRTVTDVNSLIAAGKVKPIVDKRTGAVAFDGLDDNIRDGATDACIYRRLMVSGSSLTKAKLAQAEAMAGRTVNKQALAQGVHSHDGGQTWGSH